MYQRTKKQSIADLARDDPEALYRTLAELYRAKERATSRWLSAFRCAVKTSIDPEVLSKLLELGCPPGLQAKVANKAEQQRSQARTKAARATKKP